MHRIRSIAAILILAAAWLPGSVSAAPEMEASAAVSSLIGPTSHLVIDHELKYTLADFTGAIEVRYEVLGLEIEGPFGTAWDLSAREVYDTLVLPGSAVWSLRTGEEPREKDDEFSLFFSATDPDQFPMDIEYVMDIRIMVRTADRPDEWQYRGSRGFHGTAQADVEAAPTPVEAATWGAIKRQFR